MFNRLNSALDRGLIKQVFEHVRNYTICAFILAIGTTELHQQESQFFGLIPGGYSGLGVIAIALCLIGVNLYDGLRRISRSKYPHALIAAVLFLYFFLSVRVVEMAWNFRDLTNASIF